ncbi:MAG: ankyrin repeat domain-containing protein, partial [Planctomycetota bacterium]
LLDYALTHHRLKIAQWFLDHGANPNKFNGFGENPLRLLALCPDAPESRALYASLFARGANPNLLDEWGASALGFCLKRGPTWPIPILLANGADPWAHGKDGVTQVHYAAFVGRLDLVKEFVGTKTLAEIRAITPQSFVVAAAGSGDTAVLQYFLDLGDDINAQALPLEWDSLRYQCSALHQAVQMLKPGMVNYLIQHKADPDAKDGKGETPLFLAAREGRTNCAVALIEGGANPQIEDQGELPVKCAIDYSHPETATAMEAAIAKRAQK